MQCHYCENCENSPAEPNNISRPETITSWYDQGTKRGRVPDDEGGHVYSPTCQVVTANTTRKNKASKIDKMGEKDPHEVFLSYEAIEKNITNAFDNVCFKTIILQSHDADTISAMACTCRRLRDLVRSYPVRTVLLYLRKKDAFLERVVTGPSFLWNSMKNWAEDHMPEDLRTPEIYMAAVQRKGNFIRYVPDGTRTHAMNLAAVRQCGEAIYYIPKAEHTFDIYLELVTYHGYELKRVPHDLRTIELCRPAVLNRGGALQYVPMGLRTPKLCDIAIKKDAKALQYVPLALRTPTRCANAIYNNNYLAAVWYIPHKLVRKVNNILAGRYLEKGETGFLLRD